ncbi:MAG: hypothetical protein NVS1B10_07950 [Candidatus Saccharimonadales bacterium]
MQVSLYMPIKAFSINQKSCRDARFTTSEYKSWATEVLARLEEFKALHDLALEHASKGGVFHVSLVAEFPHSVFYNKAGEVSSKTIDITNHEKPFIDLLFGHFMNVNDKFIVSMVSRKAAGATYGIRCEVELLAA